MSSLQRFVYDATSTERKVCPRCFIKVPKLHAICPNCRYNPPIFGGFLDENDIREMLGIET